MRNIIKISLFFLMLIVVFSCEDDRKKVTVNVSEITGGTISSLSKTSYTLEYVNANDNFEKIIWEATDYGYSTSITYIVQIDVTGNNFADAAELTTTTDLFAEINIEELNNILVDKLSLAPEVLTELQIRVVSTISGEIDDVYSLPITVSIAPYDPNIPPIYLVGSGQSWNMDNAVALESVAPLVYSGFVDFKTGDVFRFFEINAWDSLAEWGYSYFTGDFPDEFADNGDNDSNIKFASDVEGTYAIQVDLNSKSITVEKQKFPSALYVIGADQGWSLDDALAMRHVGNGVFVAVETLNNGNIWRFFETPSWGATQWNYNTFLTGTIDSDLSGTTEGDANFTFNGATGIYKITVSTLDLTIDIEPAEMPTMYIVGGDNSWTFGESMTWIRGEKFTQVVTLTAGNEWRFFPTSGVWGDTRDYNAFKNVDPTLWSGPNGGDANFLNLVSGTYKITIDVVPGIIIGEAQ